MRSGGVRSGQDRSWQLRSGQAMSYQVKSGQGRPIYFRSSQVRSGHFKASGPAIDLGSCLYQVFNFFLFRISCFLVSGL